MSESDEEEEVDEGDEDKGDEEEEVDEGDEDEGDEDEGGDRKVDQDISRRTRRCRP